MREEVHKWRLPQHEVLLKSHLLGAWRLQAGQGCSDCRQSSRAAKVCQCVDSGRRPVPSNMQDDRSLKGSWGIPRFQTVRNVAELVWFAAIYTLRRSLAAVFAFRRKRGTLIAVSI